MRRWILIILASTMLALPARVLAQEGVTIASLDVNFWPEYDRAEMLVINYILISPDVPLPATIDVRIPSATGSPHVVAVGDSPDLVTDQGVNFTTRPEGDWVIVSVEATGPAIQLEYYDPGLEKDGSSRSYSYTWSSEYDVQNLTFTVQKPFDATDLTSSPELQDAGMHADQLQYYVSQTFEVAAGKSLALDLKYQKPSETLSASRLQVQPVGVDENTPGRISFSNSLPYVIGVAGMVLIVGGVVYFWQSGRTGSRRRRRRARKNHEDSEADGSTDVYCHQCGTRAHAGDRFCRTCGARLRIQGE